jgi:hypothetical protein
MKKLIAAAILTSLALLAGCSMVISTEYLPYEGKDQVVDGQGGTKTVVNGMEVWANGAPPRKFKVIGLINDDRMDNILLSGSIDDDAVAKAREVGGDALINLGSQSRVTGYTTSSTTGNLNARSYRGTSFAVIQFVD